ncbi:hypothetical protein JR065_19780 [Xanthomonas sp. AmX2]|uniref:hypothetical protein n=1 Tax=Xanthomonas sp. TaxID=29446 RepID=UPI00197D0A5B|nr:hypothetical protein [Xanthomonas sp.]MBN6152578.1 hypothetical protein [Xanthomonas sp.]
MLAVLAIIATIKGCTPGAPGDLPWPLLLGLIGSLWAIVALTIAVVSRQSVEISQDGYITVRGSRTGFRPRRFHASEVESLHLIDWSRTQNQVVSWLGVALAESPGRRWKHVDVMNTHVADGGRLALFRAIACTVQRARPDAVLPAVLVDPCPGDGASVACPTPAQRSL